MTDTITIRARRYIDLLDTERGLRRHRASLDCHHMAPPRDEEGMGGLLHPDGQPWQAQPCWTLYRESAGIHVVDEYPFGDGSDRGWCEGCRQPKPDPRIAALTAEVERLQGLQKQAAGGDHG